ncbi:MAG: helix-turn-helix domain-containing protein [Hyphomicrobiaceae bacterium]
MKIRLLGLKIPELNRKPRHIGDFIKQRRLELGHSQRQVAALMGIHDRTVRMWELGRKVPSRDCTRAAVQAYLGFDPQPEIDEL